MDELGRAIHNARKANGWTQQELADWVSAEIGREPAFNQTVCSRWETSDTTIEDKALRALIKYGIGLNITEARRLNTNRERDKNPRERLAAVEYQVQTLVSKMEQILNAIEQQT